VLLYYGLADTKTTFRHWSAAVQVVRLRYGAMTEHNVIGTGWDGKKLVAYVDGWGLDHKVHGDGWGWMQKMREWAG